MSTNKETALVDEVAALKARVDAAEVPPAPKPAPAPAPAPVPTTGTVKPAEFKLWPGGAW
jgi:hypothetical protein